MSLQLILQNIAEYKQNLPDDSETLTAIKECLSDLEQELKSLQTTSEITQNDLLQEIDHTCGNMGRIYENILEPSPSSEYIPFLLREIEAYRQKLPENAPMKRPLLSLQNNLKITQDLAEIDKLRSAVELAYQKLQARAPSLFVSKTVNEPISAKEVATPANEVLRLAEKYKEYMSAAPYYYNTIKFLEDIKQEAIENRENKKYYVNTVAFLESLKQIDLSPPKEEKIESALSLPQEEKAEERKPQKTEKRENKVSAETMQEFFKTTQNLTFLQNRQPLDYRFALPSQRTQRIPPSMSRTNSPGFDNLEPIQRRNSAKLQKNTPPNGPRVGFKTK